MFGYGLLVVQVRLGFQILIDQLLDALHIGLRPKDGVKIRFRVVSIVLRPVLIYRRGIKSLLILKGPGLSLSAFAGNGAGEGLCDLNVTDFELIQRICVYYRKDIDGTAKNFVEYLRLKIE